MNNSPDSKSKIKAKRLDIPKKKCGRKRKFPNQTREIRKELCNTNKSYYNTRGDLVEARTFKPATCTCKLHCRNTIKQADQEKIFKSFHALGSFTSRMIFLSQTVEEKEKRQERSINEVSRRKFSRIYRVNHKKVCKGFFLSLLQIGESRVDTALAKWRKEELTDRRGIQNKKIKEVKSTFSWQLPSLTFTLISGFLWKPFSHVHKWEYKARLTFGSNKLCCSLESVLKANKSRFVFV